jgi:phospho-N-acetylmuramoyl-pentapeptide-transferase
MGKALGAYFTRESAMCIKLSLILSLLILSFAVFFLFGSFFIARFEKIFASGAREHLPQNHQQKSKTPTMGGVIIILSTCLSVLCTPYPFSVETKLVLISLVLFGLIGFYDDWCKVRYKKGVSPLFKSTAQFLVSSLIVLMWFYFLSPEPTVWVPFLGAYHVGYPILFCWSLLVIIGSSNAVNLSDGLDGLAITSLIPVYLTLAVLASILLVDNSILLVCSSLIGSSLAFWWFNAYPAKIFMGDVGSLSLGATLGILALIIRRELLLPLMGGVFVIEALSVIWQVFWFKYKKERFFKMAPLHHHFELSGMREVTITARCAIITSLLACCSLIIFCLA